MLQRIVSLCSSEQEFGLAQQCYFQRVKAICHSDNCFGLFAELHGDYFETLANTPAEVRQATSTSVTNLALFQDPIALCYGKEEITLGQIIEACVIHMIAGNQRTGKGGWGCNAKKAAEAELVLGNSVWYLPYVRLTTPFHHRHHHRLRRCLMRSSKSLTEHFTRTCAVS